MISASYHMKEDNSDVLVLSASLLLLKKPYGLATLNQLALPSIRQDSYFLVDCMKEALKYVEAIPKFPHRDALYRNIKSLFRPPATCVPVFEIAAAVLAGGEMHIGDYDAAVWTPKLANNLFVTVARPDCVRSVFYITFSKTQDLKTYQDFLSKLLV